MELLRWETVHPAIVHLTVGIVPVLVLLYAIGAARRSERWTFTADVMTGIAAISTVVVAAFGLVAWLRMPFAPGVWTWSVVHLVLGAAGTVLLAAFAIARLRARRRSPIAGFGAVVASGLLGIAVIVAGWVGGEVLVYKAGTAVEGAAYGTLAPAIRSPFEVTPDAAPAHLDDAMGRLRGHWADATTVSARMLVERPDPEGFAKVARAASRIEQLARWVESHPPEALRDEQPVARGGAELQRVRGEEHGHGFSAMAADLAIVAGELEDAARTEDLARTQQVLGEMTSGCAACHQQFRWREEPAPEETPR